jgi:predicted O-methyltransferase YrrM
MHGTGHNQILSEVQFIYEAAEKINPHVIVEIGVYTGGNFKILSTLLKDPNDLIIGVDIEERKWNWDRKEIPVQWRYIIGDSTTVTTYRWVKDNLQNRPIDLLYIDGSHDYDYIMLDYFLYGNLVREGGMIVFHDLNMGHENDRSVKGFWEDLKHPRKFEFSDPEHDTGCYGVGYIIK